MKNLYKTTCNKTIRLMYIYHLDTTNSPLLIRLYIPHISFTLKLKSSVIDTIEYFLNANVCLAHSTIFSPILVSPITISTKKKEKEKRETLNMLQPKKFES